MYGFGVSVKDGNPNAGRIHPYAFIFEDFLRFPDHFHFFFGVAVVLKRVDVGDRVKCDLNGVNFRLDFFSVHKAESLFGQFVDSGRAGTRHRLVRSNIDALQTNRIIDRLQSDNHLDGGTIRISHNVSCKSVLDSMSIDLGDNQGHVVVVSERRRVVDHDGSRECGSFAMFR